MPIINSKEINDKIASLPSREDLSKEQQKQEDIAAINDYALRNPNKVFDDDFKEQRKHLTEETWKAIIQANPDMQDSASDKWRKIPNSDIVNKYQGQAFSGEIRKAINEDGTKVALGALAVPGAVIGGGALAKPMLSQMFYQPGTFLAETALGTAGGYVGGKATDAVTRAVSDYDSFANMIASNSTIPEQYAEMLNPGMLLGGLAGGVGGNVLYNTVKPAVQKAALPYLMSRQLNKNIKNTTLYMPGMRYFTKTSTQPGRYQYTLYNNNGSQAGRLTVQSPQAAGTKGVHIEMVNKTGNNTGVSEDLYNVAVKDAVNAGHPGVESGENLLSAPITKHVTQKFPHNKELIGIPQLTKNPITGQYEFKPVIEGRMLTGTTNKPLAIQIPEEHIITNYNQVETIPQSNTSTSLKFYERPSTLTEVERLGIPKGERVKNIHYPLFGEYDTDYFLTGKSIFGENIGEGSESVVYNHAFDDNKVLKVNYGLGFNKYTNKGNLRSALNYQNIRNIDNAQEPINLEGFIKVQNQYRPVFSQKKITPLNEDFIEQLEINPSKWDQIIDQYIKPYYENLGFKYVGDGRFQKTINNVTYEIDDVSPYNIAITETGQIIPFDVEIKKIEGAINYLNLF